MDLLLCASVSMTDRPRSMLVGTLKVASVQWHMPLPLSVKLPPAAGTKRQSYPS